MTKEFTKLPFYKRTYWVNPGEQLKIIMTTLVIHYVTIGYLYLSVNSDLALRLSSNAKGDIYSKLESIDTVFFWAVLISSMALFMTLSLVTNRIVGPIYRLTNTLKKINAGSVETIKFRKDDFFQDLAEELSKALKTIEERGKIKVENHEQEK